MKLGEYGTSLGHVRLHARMKIGTLTWPAFDLDRLHPVLLGTDKREGWQEHVLAKKGRHSAIENPHEVQLGKDESPMQANPRLKIQIRGGGRMLTS